MPCFKSIIFYYNNPKINFFCKKRKIFERWELRPQTPLPPAAGGFATRTPASGGWGLRPQTPIGLQRLGALPPDPQSSPHCEFLATRLPEKLCKNYSKTWFFFAYSLVHLEHCGCPGSLSEKYGNPMQSTWCLIFHYLSYWFRVVQ